MTYDTSTCRVDLQEQYLSFPEASEPALAQKEVRAFFKIKSDPLHSGSAERSLQDVVHVTESELKEPDEDCKLECPGALLSFIPLRSPSSLSRFRLATHCKQIS